MDDRDTKDAIDHSPEVRAYKALYLDIETLEVGNSPQDDPSKYFVKSNFYDFILQKSY